MAKKAAPKSPFVGHWRITWMDQWEQDFVDEEVEGYFAFEPNGVGDFQFGYVRGNIDYREGVREGKPNVEFTWNGNDEMDPAQGRGWAVGTADEIEGMIFFHQGEESAFKAKKKRK
jgi:hypothetical protein